MTKTELESKLIELRTALEAAKSKRPSYAKSSPCREEKAIIKQIDAAKNQFAVESAPKPRDRYAKNDPEFYDGPAENWRKAWK